MTEPKQIVAVSYGGGIQSTAIAHLVINKHPELMAVIDRLPDCFIFADTGDEPESVYETVDRTSKALEAANIPLYVTRKKSPHGKSLSEHIKGQVRIKSKSQLGLPPLFMDGADGKEGMFHRECTSDWKIDVIHKKEKELAGLNLRKPAHRNGGVYVTQWMGISLDEIQRMRTSKFSWLKNFYPLIEMGWRRSDCIKYLETIGVTASRSACVYCPFHTNQEWLRLKSEEPEGWKHAVEFERWMHKQHELGNSIGGMRERAYLHRSRVPLDQCDFTKQKDLFDPMDNECAGVCGV